jgi:hypothetical protein
MIDTDDLCRAVRTAVKHRRDNRLIEPRKEVIAHETAIYDLFSSVRPRFETTNKDFGWRFNRTIDVRFRSRMRLAILLDQKARANWRQWDISTLIQWLIDNWETVVRTLLTIIMLII